MKVFTGITKEKLQPWEHNDTSPLLANSGIFSVSAINVPAKDVGKFQHTWKRN